LHEKKALTELINDPNIIINPVDKGGAIVVQDTSKYQQEILSQIQNTKLLPNDPTNIYRSEILAFLSNAKTFGWISQSEFNSLYCQHLITPIFLFAPCCARSCVLKEAWL